MIRLKTFLETEISLNCHIRCDSEPFSPKSAVSETEFEISVRLRAQGIRSIDLGARGVGFPVP